MATDDVAGNRANAVLIGAMFAVTTLAAGGFAWVGREDAGWPGWVVLAMIGLALALPLAGTLDRRRWTAVALTAGVAGVTALVLVARDGGSVPLEARLLRRDLPSEALVAAGLLGLAAMGCAVALARWWPGVTVQRVNTRQRDPQPTMMVRAVGQGALLALGLMLAAWGIAAIGQDITADRRADAALRYTEQEVTAPPVTGSEPLGPSHAPRSMWSGPLRPEVVAWTDDRYPRWEAGGIHRGTDFIRVEGNAIVAQDARTGEERWRFSVGDTPGAIDQVAVGGDVIFVLVDDTLLGISRYDGEVVTDVMALERRDWQFFTNGATLTQTGYLDVVDLGLTEVALLGTNDNPYSGSTPLRLLAVGWFPRADGSDGLAEWWRQEPPAQACRYSMAAELYREWAVLQWGDGCGPPQVTTFVGGGRPYQQVLLDPPTAGDVLAEVRVIPGSGVPGDGLNVGAGWQLIWHGAGCAPGEPCDDVVQQALRPLPFNDLVPQPVADVELFVNWDAWLVADDASMRLIDPADGRVLMEAPLEPGERSSTVVTSAFALPRDPWEITAADATPPVPASPVPGTPAPPDPYSLEGLPVTTRLPLVAPISVYSLTASGEVVVRDLGRELEMVTTMPVPDTCEMGDDTWLSVGGGALLVHCSNDVIVALTDAEEPTP